ncbi:MAG: recombinase family protein [Erysipelotrichia bacterium]|nr:recombinase family protein [Erysipelotrichia bacterium]
MRYGYIRVSTKDQNEDRQRLALQEYEIAKRNLFIDKQSGKDFDRPAYKAMIKKLKDGDELYIKSIDRLGRNYNEIIEQWRIITKVKKTYINVLDMPLLSTKKEDADLTGTFIADLVLQILSYVAQTERENIRQRQQEGIAAAKLKGVRFGRPCIVIPENFAVINKQYKKGIVSSRYAATYLGVSQNTFLRWSKKAKYRRNKKIS